MKTRSWNPERKDYDFIRENREIMSAPEMADYFGVPNGIMNRELCEMGLIIDEEVSTAEYELARWLNRWGRALQWEIKPIEGGET